MRPLRKANSQTPAGRAAFCLMGLILGAVFGAVVLLPIGAVVAMFFDPTPWVRGSARAMVCILGFGPVLLSSIVCGIWGLRDGEGMVEWLSATLSRVFDTMNP